MFNKVRSPIPTIASWTECSYSSQPNLLLDDQTIPSCFKVEQGDPLGQLRFALVIHSIFEKIRESIPGLLINVWYPRQWYPLWQTGWLTVALWI